MSTPAITLVMRDYDYLAPLFNGDVVPENLRVTIDRKTSIFEAYSDSSIVASELSFSGFLIAMARGDRSFVGIPFFPTRAFRHRCFFVRRDSGLSDLKRLEGKRVGTNSWPDTGNTWTRGMLRYEGVQLDRIHWWVGQVDKTYPLRPQRGVPPHVQHAREGTTLLDMLLGGELDALMCPFPPLGFYDPGGPIVRLLADYAAAERAYYQRTGIYPAHHIIGVRRELFARDPQVAASIYDVLDRARLHWQQRRLYMAELTPWTLTEIEGTMALLGPDWQPNGVSANRKVIAALCEEERAQGLIDTPLDPDAVFREFDAVKKT